MSEQVAGRIRCHKLTSTASDDQLRRILDLSNRVFELDSTNSTPHSSFEHWRERISDPRSVVFYATVCELGSDDDDDVEKQRPLGFFFNFPRIQPEIGFETIHIWLAGVDKSARGLGVFPLLMDESVKHARSFAVEYLSVATIPSRFGKMYRILRGNGWEFVAWRDGATEDTPDAKVLMKLQIGRVRVD